jgi:hypothetical protein
MKPAFVHNSSFLATLPCTAYRYSSFPRYLPGNMNLYSKKIIIFLGLLICYSCCLAQADSTKPAEKNITHDSSDLKTVKPFPDFRSKPYYTLSPKQKKQRQLLVTGINAGVYGSSFFILNQAWYKDEARTSFQTFNDSKEWLQVDKIGHGWTAYNTSRASAMLWEWAGLPHKKAVWIGGLSGFLYLTGIEFLDAHSAKWGWSWSDIGANIAGSGLFMGQEFLWKEQRIQYKFSFHKHNYKEPMLEKRADELYGEGLYERMLKDYNAQTYWFSFNLNSFLPDSNLPAWLNVAIGYGADGLFGGFQNSWKDDTGNEITRQDIPRRRQFYLAPDIDLTKIKTKSKFLRTSFSLLNAFKFPAPALMIDSKGKVKAYALYF